MILFAIVCEEGKRMKHCLSRLIRRSLLTAVTLLSAFICPWDAAAAAPGQQMPSISAFFLKNIPAEYAKIENLFKAMKDGGANTVIVGPLVEKGPFNKDLLPNIVFLAHQAGLKIFVILPTRVNNAVLAQHPDWEDMHYDLGSGTLQPAGKLDLFHPDVMNHLVNLFKDVASYSIDGILLGDDFYDEDTEGMTSRVLGAYKKKFNAALIPGRIFIKVERDGKGYRVTEYGERFADFARMKMERLTEVAQNVFQAARSVNGSILIAVTLQNEVFEGPLDAFSKYTYDMSAFRSVGIDSYWISIPHRESLGINYRKGMETIARIAKVISTSAKEPCKSIMIIQTSSSGRALPYSEIEEATEMARKGGNPCVAYALEGDEMILPAALTKKLFSGQPTP